MPPRKRILREDVLDAAIRVIRRGGAPALSVRHIAGELACSTQPIYSQFGSLEGLLEALPAYAGEKYLRFCSRSYKGFAPGGFALCQRGEGAVQVSLSPAPQAGGAAAGGCKLPDHHRPSVPELGDAPGTGPGDAPADAVPLLCSGR